MKVLRVTIWSPGMNPIPTTIVSTEVDLRLSPDYIVDEDLMGGDVEGVFVIQEVFDAPDGAEIVEATMLAQERAVERHDDERNQAILYNYEADLLNAAAENAVMFGTRPAPLSVEQVSYALKRLAAHPDYRSQTVIMPCDEGRAIVRLVGGNVITELVD